MISTVVCRSINSELWRSNEVKKISHFGIWIGDVLGLIRRGIWAELEAGQFDLRAKKDPVLHCGNSEEIGQDPKHQVEVA